MPLIGSRLGAVLALLGACLPAGCSRDRGETPFGSKGPAVRVQIASDQSGPVSLRCRGPVRLSTLPDLVLRYEGTLPESASLRVEGEGLRIGSVLYPSPLRIASLSAEQARRSGAPEGDPLGVKLPSPAPAGAVREYRGVLDLFNISGRLRIINELSIEEYLAGVVGKEMPSDFAAAALEGQAIASRTYALYHLRQAAARPLSEAFEAGPEFQAYQGITGESAAARRAVAATAGWVLTYQGKLFPAYYHSTCGGNTTNGSWVFGHEEIPPFRGVRCDTCAASPVFRWKVVLPAKQIETLLRPWAQARKVPLGELKRLEAVEPLPGGYLRYVRVVHSQGSFEMRSDRFRSLLLRGGIQGARSTSFEVELGAEPSTIELRGSGFGHGVGLCQYGAAGRAAGAADRAVPPRRGVGYGEILAHYYPESELKKIY